MKNITSQIKSSLLMVVVCGLILPAILVVIATVFMPKQANGSLVYQDGKPVGSLLIGQDFQGTGYFVGRRSASNYSMNQEVLATGSSSMAASDAQLQVRLRADKERYEARFGGDVPLDLISESASGLDPHILKSSAQYQVNRLSKETGIAQETLHSLIEESSDGSGLVNVLVLNLKVAQLR